jgi:hypothetical protein
MSNDQENAGGEKKLHIDEDWKSQVEAEKRGERPAEPAAAKPEKAPEPLPPPTLTFLASTLYLQGAIALGLLPNPLADKQSTDLRHAQHTIDLLAMLQQKTEGNRTPEESEEIEEMLHQLRLGYVQVGKRG